MRAGEHLIVDFKLSGTWRQHQLAATLMSDQQGAEQYMRALLDVGLATVIGFQGHTFEGGGVTLIFLLAESHISLHTWPEWNGFCMDFFTCGAGGESEKLFETIKNDLGDSLANVSVTTLIRHLGDAELAWKAHPAQAGGGKAVTVDDIVAVTGTVLFSAGSHAEEVVTLQQIAEYLAENPLYPAPPAAEVNQQAREVGNE